MTKMYHFYYINKCLWSYWEKSSQIFI